MQRKLGVTEFVCEINWIKCKFSAILIRPVVITTDVTLSLLTVLDERYSMRNFSFIFSRNIHRQVLRLKFAFFHFSRGKVGSHLNYVKVVK